MKYRLSGLCNQCGLCCKIGDYRCVNLIVTGEIGTTLATRCGVYAQRFSGMPIVMVNDDGAIHPDDHYCSVGTYEETLGIVDRGFDKGCSLTLEVNENG